MEVMKELLMWLLPAGGVGSLVGWWAGRRLRKVRGLREVHDTYKVMYGDLKDTLVELQRENRQLFGSVTRLERAVARLESCRFAEHCPVGVGLRSETNGVVAADESFGVRRKNEGRIGDVM